MLAAMTVNEEQSGSRSSARSARRRSNVWVLVGLVVLGCVLLLAFEEVLNLVALDLFPHHDTAECAGANTFCSPDGRAELTAGGALLLVANVAIGGALVVALLTRSRAKDRRR